MNLQRNTFVATLVRAWRIAGQVPPSGNGCHIFFTVIILTCNSATLVVANGNDKVVAKAETQPLISGGPQRGVFPPKGAGIHVHGDLVISDPVNRRGALREKRHSPRHYFAMLPYGMVRYHGAPADIRDLPPGTHLHGRFLPPLEGEEETIPLTEQLLKRDKKYGNNHAILLEDDVSFYSRQGRS